MRRRLVAVVGDSAPNRAESASGTRPLLDIYGDCLIHPATTNGVVMLTFTPLDSMSEMVMRFLPQDMRIEDTF